MGVCNDFLIKISPNNFSCIIFIIPSFVNSRLAVNIDANPLFLTDLLNALLIHLFSNHL